MKQLIISALSVLLLAQACAQNTASAVKFSASASQTEILLGNYIEVEFKLENASGAKFSAPDWAAAGFIVRGGPNQSSSFSMINGKTSSSVSYTYFVEPRDTGTLTIPAVSIKANGETVSTAPIAVRVFDNPDGVIETPQPKEHYDIWGRPTPAPQPEPSVQPKKRRPTTRI